MAAFTLIELMVVLALIGIMTAMIIPEMRGTFEDAVLRAAGRKLVDVCSLAQSRAVTRNELHRVRIDRTRSRYSIEAKSGGRFAPLTDVLAGEGEIDRRVAVMMRRPDEDPETGATPVLESAEAPPLADVIAFYPDGTADAAEIVLRDRQGFELALQVNPITGRVQIKTNEDL